MENEVIDKLIRIVDMNVGADLYLGNPIVLWVRAAVIFATIFFAIVAIRITFNKLHKIFINTQSSEIIIKGFIFSNLGKLNYIVAVVIALYPAIILLNMPAKVDRISRYFLIIAIFSQLLIWANNTLNLYARKYLIRHPDSVTAMTVFSLMWKIGTYSIIILLMLNQLGFNINALIAGLGVGGIAVAFALQNVLSDVFGSLAIIFDKPFKVGDVVSISNFTGRVEKVGLKTTRVRSLNGELLIFSNNELLKSTIQNYGGLQEKRITASLRVSYDTSYEVLKKIPDIVREAIFSKKNTSVDHVTLKEFADSSINFEVFYFIRIADDKPWAQVEHEVNLEIVRVFEKEGISFAYPTRTVYTKSL